MLRRPVETTTLSGHRLAQWLACLDKSLADNNKTPTEWRAYQARVLQVNACAKPLIARRLISCGLGVAKELMSNSQEIVAIIDDDPEMRAAMWTLVSSYGYGAHTFD